MSRGDSKSPTELSFSGGRYTFIHNDETFLTKDEKTLRDFLTTKNINEKEILDLVEKVKREGTLQIDNI
ncbi:MAG: hypothetical protein M0R03_11420 [Novosphingobium sp.]|nr:hypothetical protein [Novosphingobium sp.]